MYFLKKLTNFGKATSSERSEETVAGTSAEMVNDVDETVKEDTEESEDATTAAPKNEGQRGDSSDASETEPGIPDCFFDDVPETSSSDGVSSEEGQDSDERVISDVSNDNTENRDRLRNVTTQPTSCSVSFNTISDDSQKKTDDLNADVTDFRNGNNVSGINIAKLVKQNVEESEIGDDGRGEVSEAANGLNVEDGKMPVNELLGTSRTICNDVQLEMDGDDGRREVSEAANLLNVEDGKMPVNELLGTSRTICNDVQLEMDGNDIDPECIHEIVSFFDLHENENAQSYPDEKDGDLAEDGDDGDDGNLSLSGDRTYGLSDLEDYLEKENGEAEARLAARRQARVEAREIRLKELERQQKEQEENADRAFDMSYAGDSILRTGRITPSATSLTPRDRSLVTANSYHSSRRSSEDSIDEGLTLRDIRHELKETEEKFKKAMIANAQLDNEKSALAYQVELLKDHFEDLEETHAQLTREHRDKCREHEHLKRAMIKLKEDLDFYKSNLIERDRLIAEYGLVVVDGEEDSEGKPKRTLVSAQSAELLQEAGSGSLDVRLKKFSEEKNELLDEIRHLKLELEEEKSKRLSDSGTGHGSLTNGPLDEETNKILSDYKFKLQKAEQDVSTLQANVARLESQVIRYRTAAESSEKAEEGLKIEKRKLQRENRESIARIEELETANSHLQRRMDKLKNAKSTLLKEL